jgi:exodeoxyribonuclease VII large subunit
LIPFGLSLQIIDIDPQFTLGDLENEKRLTIKKLKEEGIYDANKNGTSLLPQRLAIISVETSKGYGDFLNVIDNNNWNYKFFYLLFPSILQGDKAVTGIAQLERIKKVIHHFDAVAIIRNGGGDVGLSCYNKYELAKAIALFPIPVITVLVIFFQ